MWNYQGPYKSQIGPLIYMKMYQTDNNIQEISNEKLCFVSEKLFRVVLATFPLSPLTFVALGQHHGLG